MRWATVGVAMLLATAACGEGRGDDSGASDRRTPDIGDVPGQPPPPVEATWVDPVATPNLAGGISVVGDDVLLALNAIEEDNPEGSGTLMRSVDRGATWEPVALPGAPANARLDIEQASAADDVVAVVGTELLATGGGVYRWTSSDGHTWQGGPVAELPEVVDEEGPAAGQPFLDGSRVSLDGGATWQDAELRTDACRLPHEADGCGAIESPVALPGAGWLATLGDDALIRSDDGIRWAQIDSPPRCGVGPEDRDDVEVVGPAALGNGWLVGFTCWNDTGDEWAAELFVMGADAREIEPVPGTVRDEVSFGRPDVLGDGTVIVAEADGDGRLSGLILVRTGS
jgi:hypothetical protein